MELDAKVEQLKAEATERWGDRWVIKTLRFADGDTRSHAVRSRGRDDEGHLIQDRLFMDEDGDTAVERVTMDREEIESETIEAPAPSA